MASSRGLVVAHHRILIHPARVIVTTTTCRRRHWSSSSSSSSSSSPSSLSSRLSADLLSRRFPLLYDDLAPQHSHLLSVALADFLPKPPSLNPGPGPHGSHSYGSHSYGSHSYGHHTYHASSSSSSSATPPHTPPLPGSLPSTTYPRRMPIGHHIVYFPTPVPTTKLLPDGADPAQSPGEPFTRRMWAGGRLRFPREGGPELDGSRAVCVEGIRDVAVKGREGKGDEKVFVGIERRVALVDGGEWEDEESIRERVWTADEEEPGESVVIERRNLVFLRERSREEKLMMTATEASSRNHDDGGGGGKKNTTPTPVVVSSKKDRVVKPPGHPEFSHSLVPTSSLLFRYSALSFNAHRIHLDASYCRRVEGHRNLLVHGPLTLTLMLTILRHHLLRRNRVVREIEYRNLAPLYVDEEMKVCGREKKTGGSGGGGGGVDGEWEVWCEGRDGGLAVKGTVRTEEIEDDEAFDLMELVFREGFGSIFESVVRHH